MLLALLSAQRTTGTGPVNWEVTDTCTCGALGEVPVHARWPRPAILLSFFLC